MSIIQVGIIGYGLSGKYLQAPFFDIHRGFNLHSIVTKSQNPCLDFPYVNHLTEINDLLYNDEIGLISICSPNPTHYDLTKKCLEAGKHVLVEKPLVATLSEAKELYDLAESKGLHLFVYQNRRFDSDFLTLKKFIETGKLGRLVSVEMNYSRYKPALNPKKWKEIQDPANGIMYDLGSHLLDQSILLFGKPDSWYGKTFTERENSDIDDAFMIWLHYPDTNVCLRSSMLICIDQPRYVLTGTSGMAVKYGIDQQEDHLKAGIKIENESFGMEDSANALLYSDGNEKYVIPTEKGRWLNLYDNIYDVLTNGADSAVKKDDILTQIEILEDVKKFS